VTRSWPRNQVLEELLRSKEARKWKADEHRALEGIVREVGLVDEKYVTAEVVERFLESNERSATPSMTWSCADAVLASRGAQQWTGLKRQEKRWAEQYLDRGAAAYGRYILNQTDESLRAALKKEVDEGRLDPARTARMLTQRKARVSDAAARRVVQDEHGRYLLPPAVTPKGITPQRTPAI
jgi:hypothetical protein